MSFSEWMEMSEQLWGSEAMQIFSQYALGQINFDTCVNKMEQAYLNFKAGLRS